MLLFRKMIPRILFAFLFVWAACDAPPPQATAVSRSAVYVEGAPKPIGPYSPGIHVGNLLFLSGQVGLDPATGQLVEGGTGAQTRQAMENLKAVLVAAGYTMDHVAQAHVFLADLNDYAEMNEVYGSFFTAAPPARAAVQVARLPRDARVEIMMTAVK